MTASLDTESAAGPGHKLARRATRAFGWSLFNVVVGRFGTLAIGIVLARVLGPESFGTFAVATVAMLAILSFNELGVSLAIVRWEDDPADIAPTVNTISVVSSLVLFILVYLTAPAFSSAMGDPSATNVVRLMSLSIVINGAVAAPAAIMQREFRQGRRTVIDQVNAWLGAVTSLVLALLGLGAMSLAIGRLAGSAVSGIMFLVWSPLPYRFGFRRDLARRLLRFGLPLAGSSVIVFAVGYADQLVTGAVLGATALGFYVLAFNLSSWPVTMFSQPLRNVAPAAFARLQNTPDRMNSSFVSVLRILAGVALPVCLLLAGAAVPIIALVYGPAWGPSASVFSALGVLAGARIFFELAYDFLVIKGDSHWILYVQLAWLAALVPALLVGAEVGGVQGVAIAQAAVAVAVVLPAYAYLLHRVGLKVVDLGRAVGLATAVALVVGLGAWIVAQVISGPLLACLLAGLLGLAGVSGLLWRNREVISGFRAQRRQGAA